MTLTTWFCPRCWHESSRPMDVCPACGYDLCSDSRLAYEERLISAVSHPVREHRMIAIEVLGRLRSRRAVPALARVIQVETDYYVIREAAKALRRIGGPSSEAALASLSTHPSPLIRKLAADSGQGSGRTFSPAHGGTCGEDR